MRKLKDKNVISNEKLFSLWARLSAVEKKVHWGLYRFELPLPPRQVLHQMVLGKSLLHRITIPEGLTVREIGHLLENGKITRNGRFFAEATNAVLLSSFGLQGKGVEGYLFPDTYDFAPFSKVKDMISAMVGQFRERFSPKMAKRAKELGLSVHEVVTLASLIEKESGMDSERPLVSAVFHNRLKSKMPLQSDPTVIYGLKHFSGTLTRKDLQSPSPYNTYHVQGLPPGPICNPGLSSLMAALHPASVPYLYFVSKNNGSHVFSVSLDDHNRAVRIYQRQRRTRGR